MPGKKNIGTNTMQMEISDTKAGATICCAPSKIACLNRFPLLQMPVDVLDRHRGIIDEDADREREPAQRHDVQCLPQGRQVRQWRQESPAESTWR